MMVNPTHSPESRSVHLEPQDWHITWEERPLFDKAALDAAVAAERYRWKTSIGATIPADFKDWHQNSDAELPEIAAWVIRNLRERAAELEPSLDAKDAEIANLREALRRLREWGGIAGKNYSATVAFDVAAWLDAGGNGPLPDAPEYARVKNAAGVKP
jgi:hypothetical protein